MPSAESIRLVFDAARLAVDVTGVCVIAAAFIWLNHGVYPVLKLRIELDERMPGLLFVGLEVENKSKVAAELAPDSTMKARLRIVELDGSQIEQLSAPLSEWVTFDENSIPVLTSTLFIEPGESIRIERLHPLSRTAAAVHCGFQMRTVTKRIPGLHDPTGSFTTTAWKLLSSSERASKSMAA